MPNDHRKDPSAGSRTQTAKYSKKVLTKKKVSDKKTKR